ncbi:MAG: FAD-dependent oxidoreductase [Pseudomonadota bacterium]
MALHFTFDGQDVTASPGDSIAAALTAAGRLTLGQRRSGAARGLFCGMGVCHDCLVTVDGQRGVRACMAQVADGMVVQREDEMRLAAGTEPPVAARANPIDTDIAIVGAGPAGLSAAAVAAEHGARVTLLDERDETGGQYFKPRSPGYRGRTRTDRQHRRGLDLSARVSASGAQILSGQGVWFARHHGPARFELRAVGSDRATHLTARAVILATGAYERPALVPGWTLPGAMSIGALQTLVRRYGVAPEGRVLIAGHGPLGLQLAAELAARGAEVVALAERGRPRLGQTLARAVAAAPRLAADGAAYRTSAARAGIPVLTGWELCRIGGETRAVTAELREIATGRTRRFEADIIAAGDGFAPQLELARLLGVRVRLEAGNLAGPERAPDGRTAVPGLWIAGDAGGLGGAEIALCQGELSGIGALAHLGLPAPGSDAPMRRRLARSQRFQSALWTLFDAPERPTPEDDTVLCRCEEVRTGRVRAAICAGARDPATLKQATRIGMGRCQGRYCMPHTLRLLREAGSPAPPEALFAPQLPARPVPLGALRQEKPEWGGHQESAPSARPGAVPDAQLVRHTADLVVIGGGVTGISAALYAARGGASVICLDRGQVNGEASGGNAGSLHLQLLSWDFGSKAVGDGSLQLRTLPLQQESIALWRTLEDDLNSDFEIEVTGGMMVAENPDQISFLEAKVAAEARVGIDAEVIDAARLRQIVPAISPEIVAAAWCPGEGKINPLVATPALARAARRAGAVIEERAPVTGIAREGSRYAIATPRGRISTARILIAAGGWSARIAAMLGAHLPIRGAPLQMVVTAPGPPLVPCLISHADRHLTMKQGAAGSVIIGGAWPAVTGPAGQAQVLPESIEGNLWVAGHTVPQVASLHVIRSWAAMNIDIDGAPLIGPVPGCDGVTVAATANGYTLGPLMGREAASAALSGRLRQDLSGFSINRFT